MGYSEGNLLDVLQASEHTKDGQNGAIVNCLDCPSGSEDIPNLSCGCLYVISCSDRSASHN
jgi:hypothetical protein